MRDALRGRKSYFIAIAMLVYAALGVVIGEMELAQAWEWVMASGAIAALRAGIKNEAQNGGKLRGPK